MHKLDNFVFGLFCGLAGVVVGMYIYYLLQYNGMGLVNFIAFARQPMVLAPLISLGALFDLGIFFFFLNRGWQQAGRGIIFSLFIYVILVIVLKTNS